jgi:hypothetical protein
MNPLTLDRLREVLSYDSDTGAFTWLKSRGRAGAGSVAGSIGRIGYRYIHVDDRSYFAHRLAWLYTHGRWPDDEIDHVNGAYDDNRLANLREATHAENARNKRKPSTNRSGAKGVSRHRTGRWQAFIGIGGEMNYLGLFDTVEAASAAYETAATSLFGRFKRAA